MNVNDLHTLKLFTSLGNVERKRYLSCCSARFLQFLCECVHNILIGNVPINLKTISGFQHEMSHLRKKSLSGAVRRKIWSSKQGLRLVDIISDPICQHLEQK